MSTLFAHSGMLDVGNDQVKGGKAIATFLAGRYGNGHEGLEPGAVNTLLIAAPVVNLSVDGRTAKGRWDAMLLHSDAKGNASIEGGIFENGYVKEDGVWKFANLHFYPQYAGPYETGWTNIGARTLPSFLITMMVIRPACPFRPLLVHHPRRRRHLLRWRSASRS